MSVVSGLNSVTTGLVFDYDSNNSRSWRGMPVTNQFAVPTPYNSLGDVTFSIQGTGTFRRIYEGTFGGYTITNNDVVYRYDLGVGGCHYHGNSVSIPAGVYPTFTFDYYISPDAANYPTDGYLANFENYGGGAQGAGIGVPNSTKGIWQTITFSGGLTTTTGTQAMFLYPGGCGGSFLASSGYILYKNPQVIFNATTGMRAPFVGPYGSRSDTQSIIDLTNNNIITAVSLKYNTNNTFTFTPGINYCTVSNLDSLVGDVTLEAVVNLATASGPHQTAICTDLGYRYGIKLMASYHGNMAVWAGFGTSDYLLSGNSIQNAGNVYIAATRSSSTGLISLYMNGALVTSATSNTGNMSSAGSGQGRIGLDYHSGGYGFNGNIFSASAYNRVLSAVEIAQNFNAVRSIYGI
jgi:hypothetical protein